MHATLMLGSTMSAARDTTRITASAGWSFAVLASPPARLRPLAVRQSKGTVSSTLAPSRVRNPDRRRDAPRSVEGIGGGEGIRTLEALRPAGFQDRCDRPDSATPPRGGKRRQSIAASPREWRLGPGPRSKAPTRRQRSPSKDPWPCVMPCARLRYLPRRAGIQRGGRTPAPVWLPRRRANTGPEVPRPTSSSRAPAESRPPARPARRPGQPPPARATHRAQAASPERTEPVARSGAARPAMTQG
jgi:hypothetical protein